ncbi:MAG: hypothetical protein OEX16_06205 [Hadesarchaea archaeon]|nr:hypothetical protein [Hadesarchaea archaeon]
MKITVVDKLGEVPFRERDTIRVIDSSNGQLKASRPETPPGKSENSNKNKSGGAPMKGQESRRKANGKNKFCAEGKHVKKWALFPLLAFLIVQTMPASATSVALSSEHHIEVVFLGNAHFTTIEYWSENDYLTVKTRYEASPNEYLMEVENVLEAIFGKQVENVQIQFNDENLITSTTYTMIGFATSLETEGTFKTMEYPYMRGDVLQMRLPGKFVAASREPDERGDREVIWHDVESLPWVKFDVTEAAQILIQIGLDGSAHVTQEVKYWYQDIYDSAKAWIIANEFIIKYEFKSDIESRWGGCDNLAFDWDEANRKFRTSWIVPHFISTKELNWNTNAVNRESPLDTVEFEVPEGMEIKKAEGATIYKNTCRWENIIDIPTVEYGKPLDFIIWMVIVAGVMAVVAGVIGVKMLKRFLS